MRIAVVGGGPGGLYFAALAKRLGPEHDITVWERRAPDETFGFGVVLSDETLGGIEDADPEVFAALEREFARWDDIDVHYRGTTLTSGGHGFAAIGRRRLLGILRERCAELGVRVRFRAEAPDAARLAAGHDLVVAADGAGSATRTRFASSLRPSLQTHRCRYIWLGTDLAFEAFTFHILDTPAGIVVIHGYPYGREGSTFIVEAREEVWRRAGLDSMAALRELCADVLDGHRVLANGSRPTAFTTVRCESWRTPRTFRSAPERSWPWRTPWPWPPACTNARPCPARWPRTRRSGARWWPRRSHPDVAEAAVVAAPDAGRGSIVAAFVVLRDGAAGDESKVAELQDFAKRAIAPYKYPRTIAFVESLPRTATGKIQRYRLRRRAAES